MYDNNDDEEDIGGRCGVMVVSLCDEKPLYSNIAFKNSP